MKKIIPQIRVKNCREALEFYKTVFNGEIKNVQTAGENKMEGHDENHIIHSELVINDDCILYMYCGEKVEPGNIDILLQLESEKEIGLIYDALGAEGTVLVKLDKQFWGDYHGVITDKYGVTWGLNYSEN